MEEKIKKLMKALDISREEAIEIINADKEIDKGKDLFPLSEEQKATEKKMRRADNKKPTVYNFKRERKPNEDKREIIQTLDDALCDIADDVTLINPERQIDFVYNDKKYRIVLSAPRN